MRGSRRRDWRSPYTLRRLPDAQAVFERLLPVLQEEAHAHDLDVEPGRLVIEVRAHGMHKGAAVHGLFQEIGAEAFIFAGDDLGDVEAFKAVGELRKAGTPTLLICSASDDQPAIPELADLADLVVPGPDGVMAFLRQLTSDIRNSRA